MNLRNVARYSCLLCDWHHDEPFPDIDNGTLAGVFGPGVMAAVSEANKRQRIEHELEKHFATHSTLEWVDKVTALQIEVSQLSAMLIGAAP